MTMHVTIPLDQDLFARARTRAADLGLSLEDYLERLLIDSLSSQSGAASADVTVFFDIGESNQPTDVGRDKDKMIGDAVWERHRKRTGQE